MATVNVSVYPQPRVILWSVPRSCTTAVLRSVSNIKSGKYYFEHFSNAFYYGPEKNKKCSPYLEPLPKDLQLPGADLAYDASTTTFSWVKQTLESEHTDATLVFAKDFPFCLEGKLERLPRGYYHSFLIRTPEKVIPSWRKINHVFRPPGKQMDEQPMEEWHDIQLGKYAGFKDLLELYKYVKENLDPNPFVMDADDLIAQPEAMMAAYCRATGIPFCKALFEWDDWSPNWITCWNQLHHYKSEMHINASSTRRWVPEEALIVRPSPTSKTKTNPKVSVLVERCMPFYNQLYQERFVP